MSNEAPVSGGKKRKKRKKKEFLAFRKASATEKEPEHVHIQFREMSSEASERNVILHSPKRYIAIFYIV